MSKMRKLLFAGLLCIAILCVAMLPASASVIGETEIQQTEDTTPVDEGIEEAGAVKDESEKIAPVKEEPENEEALKEEVDTTAEEAPIEEESGEEKEIEMAEQPEEGGNEEEGKAEEEKEEILDQIAGPDGPCFTIQTDSGKMSRSVNHASKLPVNSVRFDKFYGSVGIGDYDNPQLGMGIKYIDKDNETPDADGKWRYVYCLNFKKSSPTGQTLTYQGGWTNRKIAYCLYYGAMFWRQPCRYEKYSTGDWQLDYFVTQNAVHILNGEYSLAGAFRQIDLSTQATSNEKTLAKDRINKLVGDANNSNYYDSFTSEGWFDASAKATFSVSTPSDFASTTDGFVTGYSSPSFKTAYNLDLKEQITSFQVSVPSGVQVQKKDKKTYSDFRLFVNTAQYKSWQLTGKTITATVKATAPKWWGGGIYKAPSGSSFQDCVMWTYTSAGGNYTKTASFSKKIPKKTFSLEIQKKDAVTDAGLSGAKFSLWAYDGTSYQKKLGMFTDKGGGTYSYTGITYDATKDGWFLVKEEEPPPNYEPGYVLYNNADRENYQKYGGREIQLTADGFVYDGVSDAAIFKNFPKTPKVNLSIRKSDASTGNLLEGAEFQVYEWDRQAGGYKKEATCTLVYNKDTKRYVTEKPLEKTESNTGKFKVAETRLPQGYACPWSQEIEVTEKGTVTLELEAINYPVRNLIIQKKIQADEITWAHGNPTFLFTVTGTDLQGIPHSYHRVVEFTRDQVQENSKDGFVILETVITDIPAGTYQVMEDIPVMRYVLTDVTGSDNVTVTKTNIQEINGFMQIQADVSANLTKTDGMVRFENHKTRYDKVSHNSAVTNKIK